MKSAVDKHLISTATEDNFFRDNEFLITDMVQKNSQLTGYNAQLSGQHNGPTRQLL